jgi:hypothetical protein
MDPERIVISTVPAGSQPTIDLDAPDVGAPENLRKEAAGDVSPAGS